MMCLRTKCTSILINPYLEYRLLRTDGWITDEYQLTQKAINFLDETESLYTIKQKKQGKIVLGEDSSEYITKYREIFPKGNLPSGSPSRINPKDLLTRFTWFFNTYPDYANWKLILEVTKKYIDEFSTRGYIGMRNSGYFIQKQMVDKTSISDLATWCGQHLDGEDEVQDYDNFKMV